MIYKIFSNTISFNICMIYISMQVQKSLTKQNIEIEAQRNSSDRQEVLVGTRIRKQRASSPSIFISKTFEILQNDQFKEIIRWNQDGTSFIIQNVQKFQEEVLPIYFRHRNFSSFVRQLNMYDFHKIRNQANLNIFQHKQFRRYHKQTLKNIKRKGCHGKKPITEEDGNYKCQIQEPEPIKSHKTVQNSKALVQHSETIIPKMSPLAPSHRINIKRPVISPISSPFRKRLIEEFINGLPETIQSQAEIEQIIRQMKKNPKYNCLDSKQDLRKIVKKIKQTKLCRPQSQQLQDLSIEQEIIVQNIRGPHIGNPSLAIFSTQKFLPIRSISLIGSLNFGQDIQNLIYPC